MWRGGLAAGVACLIGAFVLAAPAGASTLTTTNVTPPDWFDPCGGQYRVDYQSKAGEANRVETAFTPAQYMEPLTPGPICWQITPDAATVSDTGATITARRRCESVSPTVGHCEANNLVGYLIHVGDQRDVVRVTTEGPPATVIAGIGNDQVNTANGTEPSFVPDTVYCGPGTDAAVVDAADQVGAGCERVTRH
jgi:hypothetical protein